MRALVLLAALSTAGAPTPQTRPAPGWYCPIGVGNPISIDVPKRGEGGIDGMACYGLSFRPGVIRGAKCYGNHFDDEGSPFETDLFIRDNGDIVHDGVTYRRYDGPMPCPGS